MRLLRTELIRFWSRRIVWAVALVVMVVSTVAGIAVFASHSNEAPDNEALARTEAERATEECVRFFRNEEFDSDREQIARDFGFDLDSMTDAEFDEFLRTDLCYQDPQWFRPEDPRFFAAEILVESYEARQMTDWSSEREDYSVADTYRFGVREIRQANDGFIGILPVVATFYLVIAVLIGASFVGGEYRAGTLENLLLWEPRRLRVLWTKFAAGFLSSAALTAALLAWLTVLLYLVATQRGDTSAVDGRFWIDIGSTIGRGALVGGLFFVAAMSVSIIARNTAAAVGLILGWFAISNIVIELAAKWLRQWELFNNATAFIREADAVRNERIQGFWQTVYAHGYVEAGLVTVMWVAALALPATLVFIRRDID